jgi:hypothetical protein
MLAAAADATILDMTASFWSDALVMRRPPSALEKEGV